MVKRALVPRTLNFVLRERHPEAENLLQDVERGLGVKDLESFHSRFELNGGNGTVLENPSCLHVEFEGTRALLGLAVA